MVKLKVLANINSADLVIKANSKLTNSIFIQLFGVPSSFSLSLMLLLNQC